MLIGLLSVNNSLSLFKVSITALFYLAIWVLVLWMFNCMFHCFG